MKNKIILIVVIVLLGAGIAYKLTVNKKSIDNSNVLVDNSSVAIPVSVITAQKSVPNNSLIKSGTLLPYKEADISAVSGGKLITVNFELGDFVSKGAVLATVDSEMLQLNLNAAKIALDQAKRDYDRLKALYEGDAATEQNYQNAQLQLENADNQIEQLKKQIADNQIKAPISGQIISKLKEAGEFIGPGNVIGQLVQVDKLKVGIMVSEGEVYSLEKGNPVTVTTDVYPGEEFEGKISFISSNGDAVHNYKVEVSLTNEKEHALKAGTFAYVDFLRKSANEVIIVPKAALIESIDRPMVYVVKENRAVVKNVVLGSSYGNNIEVVSGVEPGEMIVVSGLVNISEGSLVDPVKQ